MSKQTSANRMGTVPVPKLMLSMGIPMIFSMMLQALYNIVDSAASVPVSGSMRCCPKALDRETEKRSTRWLEMPCFWEP